MTSTLVICAPIEAGVATISVAGPLLTTTHSDELREAAERAATCRALVIDLSNVTVINDHGLADLRRIAERSIAAGQRMVFVCTELILRSELILADLDTLAPVLDRSDHATSLFAA